MMGLVPCMAYPQPQAYTHGAPPLPACLFDFTFFGQLQPPVMWHGPAVFAQLAWRLLTQRGLVGSPACPFAVSFWVHVPFLFGSCSITGPA